MLDPEVTPVLRDLLEAHQKAILRELDQSRQDTLERISELREDQRKDMAAVAAREEAHEARTRRVEARLGYLGALHLVGMGALVYLLKRALGIE